jgi:colanic acid biosynthesis protein WcaH
MDDRRFLEIIAATPLVSIDLIIRNEKDQVLLGKRVNRPAQNLWFVPGGRIRKNERIQDAFARIFKAELGISSPFTQARLLGAYDHIYDDNFLAEPNINTHYVVLAFTCTLESSRAIKPDLQHESLDWWDIPSLLASSAIHENTKLYFR